MVKPEHTAVVAQVTTDEVFSEAHGSAGSRRRRGRVFEKIRSDILTCSLLPDARLRLEELRSRYNVGFSPLREALMRLQAEGLVVLVQNKGFRVAPVSQGHLLDLSRVRAEIDCLALRWAIQNGNVSWEAEILSAFHRLARQPKIDSAAPNLISTEWSHEHRLFHSALVAACDSKMLRTMHDELFDQTERYVAISILQLSEPRDDVTEHEELMQAALARDAERICNLCRLHVQRTVQKVLSSRFLSS